jgi:hypothetical protein
MSGLPIDPDTRILTRKGWRNYQDYIDGLLTVGEDIYTYESSSRTFKWEPLVSVVFHGSGLLASINLQNTLINNSVISLIMGEKVPWIIEVVKKDSRRLTGYDSIKLKEIDNSQTGIGEKRRSDDMGTTYYLILGKVDNLVTHQENDNRIDTTYITVSGAGAGMTWTPYTTNETVVVQQSGLVFCVGTLSLRDKIGKYSIPSGNINELPIALNGYVLGEKKAIQLKTFSGFSPLINTQITSVTLQSIPPASEGIIYKANIPITNLDLPLTLTLNESNELIYIPNKTFLGISSITYKVIDSLGNTSVNTGNINITVVNNEETQLATELTLNDIKDLITDLPNQTLSSSITNLPTDYSKELTLSGINNKLSTLLSILPVTNTTTLFSATVNDANVIPAGCLSIDILVITGPVIIAGRTYNTGDPIKFEPMNLKVYPAIPYDATGGSITYTIIT